MKHYRHWKSRGVFVLTVIAVSLLLSLTAFAEHSVVDSGKTRGGATWTYYSDGELVIGGSVDTGDYDYNYDPVPWDVYRYSLTNPIRTVTIEEGVERIGKYALMCLSYVNINLPTTLKTISPHAFYSTSFRDMTMHKGVTTIEYDAFSGGYGSRIDDLYFVGTGDDFAQINMGDSYIRNVMSEFTTQHFLDIAGRTDDRLGWNISGYGELSITGFGPMQDYSDTELPPWYAYRDSITSVNVGSGVLGIGAYAFYGFENVSRVSSPSARTVGANAFRGCTSLTEISLESVNTIGESALRGCTSLAAISLSENIETIGESAFRDCASLTEMILSEKVNAIAADTFRGCTSLSYVWLPNAATIYTGAFADCSGLKYLGLSNNMNRIRENAFSGCSALQLVFYHGTEEAWNSIRIDNGNALLTNAPRKCFESGFAADGPCGENLRWILSNDNTLYIVGTGAMDDYSYVSPPYIYAPWYDNYYQTIVNVVVDEGVTSIGDYAFYCLRQLESVSLPASLQSIGKFAFDDVVPYSHLTDVCYAGTPTERAEISIGANNDDLNNAQWHYFVPINCLPCDNGSVSVDVVGLVEVGSTATITATPADGYQVRRIYINGEEAEDLTFTVDFHNDISAKFEQYSSTGQCGDNVFWTYYPDGELVFSGTGAMYAYNGSRGGWRNLSFTKLTVLPGVTGIRAHAFQDYPSLESVYIADSVHTLGEYVLDLCSGLKNVKLPSGIEDIPAWTFSRCNSLESVTIPEGVKKISTSAFSECPKLTSITLPRSITTIGGNAFTNLNKLRDVYYAGSAEDWSHIRIANTSNAPLFNATLHCKSVVTCLPCENGSFTVDVEGLVDPGTVITVTADPAVGYLFKSVSVNGEVIEGTSFTVAGDSEISVEFEPAYIASGECGANLTWEFYDNGELIIRGTGAMTDFYETSTTPGWETYQSLIKSVVIEDGATSIGGNAFYTYSELEDVSIPASVTSIGQYAFDGCSNLKSITLPESLKSIGKYSFYKSGIEELVIPESVSTIDSGAFSSCTALRSVTVGSGVNSLPDYAFNGCTSLTSLTLPLSLKSIGASAFQNCTALADVYYEGTSMQWSKITIDRYNEPLNNATLHCAPHTVVSSGMCGDDVSWTLYNDGELVLSGTGETSDFSHNRPGWYYQNRTSIYTVTVEDGVNQLGLSLFYDCSKLASVSIPQSVTFIAGSAFKFCSALTDIYYGGDEAGWKQTYAGSTDGITIHYAITPREITASGSFGNDVTWTMYADGELVVEGPGAITDKQLVSLITIYEPSTINVQNLTVAANKSIELDGAVLTVEKALSVSNSGSVNGGTLRVKNGATVSLGDNGGYVPVPTGTEDGYKVYDLHQIAVKLGKTVTNLGTGARFALGYKYAEHAAYGETAAAAEDFAGVLKLGAHVSWGNDSNELSGDLIVSKDSIAKMSEVDAEDAEAFYRVNLSIRGAGISEISAAPMISCKELGFRLLGTAGAWHKG